MDSRIETLLKALLNGDSVEDFEPQSRVEHYLKNCILQSGVEGLPDPQSRLDALLYQLAGKMPEMGGSDLPTQTKTITPTTSEQSISPDVGYKLIKVIVQAVTSAIDANIKAENIKEGVSILGVAGTEKGFEAGKQVEYDAFWDNYQSYGARLDYRYAFANYAWNDITYNPKYPIVAGSSAEGMYYLTSIGSSPEPSVAKKIIVTTSKTTYVGKMFYFAKVKQIGELDFSKATTVSYAFAEAQSLVSIDKIISSETTAWGGGYIFDKCTALTHVIFEGTIAQSLNLSYSSLLDAESILSIIRALKKFAPTDTGYLALTLTLNANAWATISTAYPNGTEDMPLADGETWQDYVLSIGWHF